MPERQKTSKGSSAVAGAGGGTVLILFARTLPDTYALKAWLIVMSPTLAVILAAVWAWGSSRLIGYYLGRAVNNSLAQLRQNVADILANEKLSPDMKAAVVKELEEAERLNVARQVNDLKAVVIDYSELAKQLRDVPTVALPADGGGLQHQHADQHLTHPKPTHPIISPPKILGGDEAEVQ